MPLATRSSSPRDLRIAQFRRRFVLGVTLAATGGAVFGFAWASGNTGWWWVGALTVLSGALVILSGMQLRRDLAAASIVTPSMLLGELLITKQWITDGQLANALVRHHYTKRPIGQILVEMGAITPIQLADALRQQGLPWEAEEQP
jgi:hypothetical protein